MIRQIAGVVLLIGLSSSFLSAHATSVGSEVSITPPSDSFLQAEVAIAVSPSNNANLLAGYMTMAATQFQLEHATSGNVGTSWQNNARFSLAGFNKFVDPTVGYNSGGTPYFVGLAEASGSCITDDKSNCNASLIISKSTDGGPTWTTPNVFTNSVCANGVGSYHDKPSMKVDTSSSSPYVGKIFVSWTRIDGCPSMAGQVTPTSVMLARLTDTGSAFSEDVETRVDGSAGGNTNTQVAWTDVALAPNGDLYVGWAQVTTAPAPLTERITLEKSTDGGHTFTALSTPGILSNTIIDALHRPGFEIAVDPGVPSNVYVVYEDSSSNSGDVIFRRSTDRGSTWASAVTVNSNTNGIQSFPAMSVVSGRIDIIWYDSRNFPQQNDHLDVFYSQSLDGGQTFSTDIKIDSAAVPTGTPFLGDYIGIASSTNYVYTAWIGPVLPTSTDTRDPIFTLLSSPGTGGGGGGSIASGTLVTMADGTREPVQNLAVGDKLLMYDVYSHTSVTATLESIPTITVHDKLTIFTDGGMPLRVDANPRLKFYVLTSSGPVLKPVTDFQTGDLIYNYDLARWVPVTHVETSFGGNHFYYDLLTRPYLTSDGHFLNFIANGYADPCNPICKEGPSP